MSSSWGDNIFTTSVIKVSSKKKKKKAVAATSVLASSSAITGSQGTSTSGSAAAAGAMCQVQCNNQNKELLPRRRSPVPMTTPVSTSSTNDQNAHSRPNSRMGAEITHVGSTMPSSALSIRGSLASGNVLPQSVSSVLTGKNISIRLICISCPANVDFIYHSGC
jgi:hypothetical protein